MPLLSRQKDEREDLDLVEEIEREFRIYSKSFDDYFPVKNVGTMENAEWRYSYI